MQNLWSISSFLFSENGGRALLFIIFQYVFKVFSLLAVLGQVIPGGSESPFRAAGLRRCRAWNPITSAAMLALWHQTPSMQNATAGVYQQLAPQFSYCRGVHWWVARLTRGRRDDTGDNDVGQNGEHRGKGGLRKEDGWGWGRWQAIIFEHKGANYNCWWSGEHWERWRRLVSNDAGTWGASRVLVKR